VWIRILEGGGKIFSRLHIPFVIFRTFVNTLAFTGAVQTSLDLVGTIIFHLSLA